MSFEALKAKRGTSAKLIEEINKLGGSGGGNRKRAEDERFWKPQVDKAGNGYAVIRFLPSRTEEDLPVPFVTTFDHGFQGPSGRWYIENSLTTVGKDDPVSEFNSKLWNSGVESDKETARKQKRRLHYIGNILVVKDSANPANEGKVFLYKFGAKIYGKIKDAMSPPEGFEDETPIVPYDFWEGANFKLKIRKVEGFPNYDSSVFDDVSAVSEDDAVIEKIYEKINSLKPFVTADGKDADGNPYFKTYAELKEKLYKVLDLHDSENTDKPNSHSTARVAANSAPKATADVPWNTDEEPASSGSSEDEDELAFFKRLASE